MLQRGAPSLADSSNLSTPTTPSSHLSSPSPTGSWGSRSLREPTRPSEPASPPSTAGRTTRRPKPLPSPLQQSSQQSQHHSAYDSPEGGPRSPRSPQYSSFVTPDGPASPREKLDALLAEEDSRTSAAATPTQNYPPTPPTTVARGPSQPAKPSSYAQLRNVSAPVVSSAGISPPSSPIMPPPSRPSRPEVRPTTQRNPSMDSQVSSLSSNASQSYKTNLGHQHKSSQDAVPSNPPDMAALIARAGSPEAALLAMWKEKHTIQDRNDQLWRLVDKQRAMILGLNKDLERTLKDKERYRKKLKDYVNQVPPVPGAPQRSDTFDSVVEREQTPSPAPSERPDDTPKAQLPVKSLEHKTSPLAQGPGATQLIPESQLAQSPAHSSDAHTASNPASAINSPTDYTVQPLNIGGKGLGLNSAVTTDASTAGFREPQAVPDATPRKPSADSTANLAPPALSLTQATPVLGGDGFEAPAGKPAQPLRKPPPAPLNLAKPPKISAHLHQAVAGEQSDDEYDDTLEVDEIPIVERGRRKTREEDDRVREAMMMKDEDARSKSKKKKSEAKIKAKVADGEGADTDASKSAAGSLSPRMFSPTQAGLPLSPRHPPPGSINALLSPTNSDSSMVANRSIASPLMSPGLPMSPRPGDRPIGSPTPRNPKQSLASPPMSPRTVINGAPQQAPRPPRQPIPLPPNTPQSINSTQASRAEVAVHSKPQSSTDLLRPPNAQPSPDSDNGGVSQGDAEHVYRGLVSEQYPGLLLPPNALPSIDVKVFSSRLRPSRLSFLAPKPQEEDPVFILAIYARSNSKQLWRVEKTIMALPALHAHLQSLCDFHGKLPDRALFSGHAPAKMDARRAALNLYFDTMLETPMTEKAALVVCEFFSTDVIGVQNDGALAPEPATAPAATASTPSNTKTRQRKEGYLTKRGKNFGGWKARYFILDGPEFRYYESAGGAHLGTIKLQSAQIGKQSQQQTNQSPQRRDDSEDNQYRHAFLILEPKRKDSSSLVRHVLCAESDEERDAWVDALLQHVDWQEEPSPTGSNAGAARNGTAKAQANDNSRTRRKDSPEVDQPNKLQGFSYDDTSAAQAPIRGATYREAKEANTQSPKNASFGENGHHPSISGPTNGAPIQDAGHWGNKSLAAPTTNVKDKKRSIFGFRGRGSSDLAPGQLAGQQAQQQAFERNVHPNRNIFGIPLQEAVDFTQPVGIQVQLPAVVYRCIEYLRNKNAHREEGIFRLSGSNIVIKGLRERFNNEGDINLLGGDYYDVHAVASLLKLYLRELPASILTRELHLDFLKVLDLDERSKKIQAFNVLVHRLPAVNFELIRTLSSYLIQIVDNSIENKMTVRNVGIVFAPTLNIPAPLIAMFLQDYPDIFGTPIDEANSPINEIHISTPPLGDEAIRSPRHQMFSDLPTPAYNNTSFQSQDVPPSSFPVGPSTPLLQPPRQQQYPPSQSQYAGYDTGFIPMRPSYDAPQYEQQFQSEGYGSLNSAVLQGNSREAKQRRRESGMLLMNMGMPMGAPRTGSNTRAPNENVRKDPRMVREETAFD